VFLLFTLLTSVTGLMFPFNGFLPSHAVTILSLVLLAVAIFALYGRHIAGPWRAVYIVAAMLSLYLNVFVLVVQMFARMPQLKALAPNGNEAAFVITQVLVLAAFVWLIHAAVKRFRRAGVERR
jgi:K+-transporting ATPase A subunit